MTMGMPCLFYVGIKKQCKVDWEIYLGRSLAINEQKNMWNSFRDYTLCLFFKKVPCLVTFQA